MHVQNNPQLQNYFGVCAAISAAPSRVTLPSNHGVALTGAGFPECGCTVDCAATTSTCGTVDGDKLKSGQSPRAKDNETVYIVLFAGGPTLVVVGACTVWILHRRSTRARVQASTVRVQRSQTKSAPGMFSAPPPNPNLGFGSTDDDSSPATSSD